MCAVLNYDKVFEISKFAKLKDLYFKFPLCGSCIATYSVCNGIHVYSICTVCI